MAATFASIAMLAKVGGGWAVEANQYGRHVAIVLGPLAALGGRLSESNDHSHDAGDVWPSLLLGVATGLLWAPCAGPVLILSAPPSRARPFRQLFPLLAPLRSKHRPGYRGRWIRQSRSNIFGCIHMATRVADLTRALLRSDEHEINSSASGCRRCCHRPHCGLWRRPKRNRAAGSAGAGQRRSPSGA